MTTNRQHIQQYIRNFDFKRLFVDELGWDNLHEQPLTISLENHTFLLQPLVEKRGFKVYLCEPGMQGKIPANPVMSKIEHEATRYAYEHLIIYIDAAREKQVWQWVKRTSGAKSSSRLNRFQKGQSGELLAQKVEQLEIALDEEAALHMTDVAGKVAKAFDVERVTRKFYDRFKLEHGAFLNLISGIEARTDREWYASLMLNRLMFIYFIQRKGFLDTRVAGRLDGDTNYLSNRLRRVRQERGENEFHSFYHYFLLRLFHDGLSKREHSPELEQLLGKVPYLNGGLFDLHLLEHDNPKINIPDEAFEKLFSFFDDFDWHLDDRPLRNDREINPDVLGYIFEKYINQKQMGAYYTKEDITGYISKNTIIPYLFDAAEQKCLIAFRPVGPVWSLLRENPDAYIYDAVKKGCDLPLLPEIEVGVHDVSRRSEWNKPAPEEYALPTEIWREVVARRTRYAEVRAKLAAGEMNSINDLVTYNLNIRRFAEDAITYCEGTDLLRAFYDSIQSVTVLDPTCGSGAFLFAALNILETLYEACLERMQDLAEEHEALDAAIPVAKRFSHPDINHFREILNRVRQHPSRTYFIYKSIIINNLYGVDIMEEATEICKLRLFLKLVSQIEQFDDIEPLPDIDFNIRAGNTLVGFASQEETRQALSTDLRNALISGETMGRIEQKAREIERDFENFRRLQTQLRLEPEDMAENKQRIRQNLQELGSELDRYLAAEYGIDPHNITKKAEYDEKFAHWQQSHQPFHWWVEFYGIMKCGGFDVIIGNPPWKEYSSVRKTYTVRNYVTEGCGNLYGICTERALSLRSSLGWMSYIVQLPLASSSRMISVRNLLKQHSNSVYVITFDDRPGKLFEGLQHCRSVIFISQASKTINIPILATTRYQRWSTEVRDNIFYLLEYAHVAQDSIFPDQFPKYANAITERVLCQLLIGGKQSVTKILTHKITEQFIFYQEATQYWIKATVGLPYYAKNAVVGAPAHGRFLYFEDAQTAHVVCAILNSSLFYIYFIAFGDCFHLSETLVGHFPLTPEILKDATLAGLSRQLMAHMTINAERKTIRTYDGDAITYANFYGAKSKPIIDEIDRVLANHYGFADEELDFIINYDIKYRMGHDNGDESEE